MGGSADERVLVVPADAVATLDGQTVVFVPPTAEQLWPQPVAIVLGRRAGEFFEVRSGLEEGAVRRQRAFTLKSAAQRRALRRPRALRDTP